MSSEKLLEVNENILSELTKLRKEVSEIKKGLNKSNPNKQKNNESYENLFDTELMKEILSEEKMYNIHKFMDLLENLKNGKPSKTTLDVVTTCLESDALFNILARPFAL